MTNNSDPHFNLADALSEDIVAAPADTLVHDAGSDPDGRAGLVTSFDRITARAVAQSRRRRIAARLRGLLQAWPLPIGWTSAMAGVASICVVVIAGGLYVHQQEVDRQTADVVAMRATADRLAETPATAAPMAQKRASLDRMAERYEPLSGGSSMSSYVENRAAVADRASQPDQVAAAPPAQAPPPPAVAAAPPPAPPAAAGVADEPRRVPTVTVRDDAEAGANALPPRVLSSDMLDNALRDSQIALAIERQGNAAGSRTRSAPAPAAESAYAPSLGLGPASQARSATTYRARRNAGQKDDVAPSFAWPLRGRVLAAFGASVGGLPNNGIDVAAPVGTDIRAAEGGVVAYAGGLDSFGNMILLRHPDGYLTVYAHAQSLTVKPGDTVRRGQVIAKSGQSGAASAPQLHFEIRKGATAVNPVQYLPPPG